MRLSTKNKTSAEDVRRVLLAAVADALDEGKQEAKKRPGLTGMRAVATGAVIYTAGRAAFASRRFARDHFGTDHDADERDEDDDEDYEDEPRACLLYTSPSPRDGLLSRMPSSA